MPEDPKQHSANEGNRTSRDNGNPDHGNHDDDDKDHRESPGRVIHPKPTHGDYAVRARLAHSRNAMQEFSSFSYEEIPGQRGPVGVWAGKVRPLRLTDGL